MLDPCYWAWNFEPRGLIELYLGTNWTTIWMVSTSHLHLWTKLLFTSPRISCNSQTLRQVFDFSFFVFLRIIQLFSIAILTNAKQIIRGSYNNYCNRFLSSWVSGEAKVKENHFSVSLSLPRWESSELI